MEQELFIKSQLYFIHIFDIIKEKGERTPLRSRGFSRNFCSAFSGPPSCTSNVLKALSVGTNIVYGPVTKKNKGEIKMNSRVAINFRDNFYKIIIVQINCPDCSRDVHERDSSFLLKITLATIFDWK